VAHAENGKMREKVICAMRVHPTCREYVCAWFEQTSERREKKKKNVTFLFIYEPSFTRQGRYTRRSRPLIPSMLCGAGYLLPYEDIIRDKTMLPKRRFCLRNLSCPACTRYYAAAQRYMASAFQRV